MCGRALWLLVLVCFTFKALRRSIFFLKKYFILIYVNVCGYGKVSAGAPGGQRCQLLRSWSYRHYKPLDMVLGPKLRCSKGVVQAGLLTAGPSFQPWNNFILSSHVDDGTEETLFPQDSVLCLSVLRD